VLSKCIVYDITYFIGLRVNLLVVEIERISCYSLTSGRSVVWVEKHRAAGYLCEIG
jgi:hypothetical protein